MSKLTEIKEQVQSFSKDPRAYGVLMTVEQVNYLLSLLEEKDKALTSIKGITWCKQNGNEQAVFDIARKALNTTKEEHS